MFRHKHTSVFFKFWLFTSPSESGAPRKGGHLYLVCCIYVPPTSSLLSCSVSVSTKRFYAPQGSHKPIDPADFQQINTENLLPHNSLHLPRNKRMFKVKDPKEASLACSYFVSWPLSPCTCSLYSALLPYTPTTGRLGNAWLSSSEYVHLSKTESWKSLFKPNAMSSSQSMKDILGLETKLNHNWLPEASNPD